MQLEQHYYEAVIKLVALPFDTIPFFGPTMVLTAVISFFIWLVGGSSGTDTDTDE